MIKGSKKFRHAKKKKCAKKSIKKPTVPENVRICKRKSE